MSIECCSLGAFGKVYRGRWRSALVAIKTLRENLSSKQLEDFQAEASVMAALRPHSNVVQLLGICTSPPCIVTEFMKRGSLYSYLRSNQNIPASTKLSWLSGIASGMLHLHTENIVHRDLAARNILLGDTEFIAKISDFGMSRALLTGDGSQTQSDVGPLKHMAPESLLNRTYSFKSDSWAFAITCIELITQDDPYPELSPLAAATRVTQGFKHPIPNGINPTLSQLIVECLETEPTNRPDFMKIVSRIEKISEFTDNGNHAKPASTPAPKVAQNTVPPPLHQYKAAVPPPLHSYGPTNQPKSAPAPVVVSTDSQYNKTTPNNSGSLLPSAVKPDANKPPKSQPPNRTSQVPPVKSAIPQKPNEISVKTPAASGGLGKLKVGDSCQAIWHQDGLWYLATVMAIKPTAITVKYDNYGNLAEVAHNEVKEL